MKKVKGYSVAASWASSGRGDGRAAFARIEDKRLFLLRRAHDAQAARTIYLASIAEVKKLPALECGQENCILVTLKPGAHPRAPVRIVAADEITQKQIYNRLRTQGMLASAASTAKGAAATVGSVLGSGARTASHFFSVGLGSGVSVLAWTQLCLFPIEGMPAG